MIVLFFLQEEILVCLEEVVSSLLFRGVFSSEDVLGLRYGRGLHFCLIPGRVKGRWGGESKVLRLYYH